MASTDPLHDALADAGERFALHLRSDDAARASRAMQAVAAAVRSLTPVPEANAPRTSALAPVLDGLLLRIDELSTRVDARRRLAVSIRTALAEAGLADAPVSVLAVDGLRDLDECRRAVVLRMFPAPAGSAGHLDPAWIDVAAEWVFGDQRPDADVRLRVLGVEFLVRAAEAAGVLHGCAAARAWCDVVTGDVKARLRTASISFGAAPHVAIAGGGPRCDDDGLVARFELLAEVAKELAHECAYACLDFEETFGELGNGLANSDWAVEGGAAPNTIAGRLCDRHVPDAYGHQIIGPQHVDRLLQDDPERAWGAPLPGGRRELRIGDPIDWLLSSEVRADVRADGWDLLDGLLLREGELDAALADTTPARSSGPASDGTAAARNGVPDFDSIVIDSERHARRGTRLTVLELAAWLGGEAHTDEPMSVSPVLRLFIRHLARGLDDRRRQQLKPIAPRLVGSDQGPEDERRRAWELTDWLVRVHAPPWLRRAGLTESADRLDGLDSITSTTDLVRAVDLLGNAIVTASRRLEITTTIAGERAELVDQIAWDVWETAAERTGWMAASEAVLFEIPSDLAFAADARVIECSRDPRTRTELEATSRGLGDAIWAAALQEIAAAAWQSAWAATESFVHHESTFSIGTALRRSLESELAARADGAMGDGTGDSIDDMGVDVLLDEVDAAVRDALAHLVLSEGDEIDYWKRAVDAACEGESGMLWRRALDGTRGVLGPVLFDDAIDVARAELHRWLDEAPRMVGRAVAAAVAREACGVAGRGIAARAAAESLARGDGEQDGEQAAERAAWHVISGIVDDLADDSLRMVEVLLEPAHHPRHQPAQDEAVSPV